MNFAVIKKRTTSEIVADQLLGQLRFMELKPGEKLPAARDLAKMFGVGRSSVREAIKALDAMGVLQVIQGKGTYVAQNIDSAKPDTETLKKTLAAVNIHSLLEARQTLECKSAELAAQRANPRQILQIGKAIIEMQKPNQDDQTFLSADRAFHLAVADGAENPVIYDLVKLLVTLVHENDIKFLAMHDVAREKTIDSVNNVLFYIRQGDGKMAALSMSDHFDVVTHNLSHLMSGSTPKTDIQDWVRKKTTAPVRE